MSPLVRFLSPGAYPTQRGTPLAIRWLAEAWAERGGRGEVWTADACRRTLPPVPGRPPVAVRRCGPLALHEAAGPSARRAAALLALGRALRAAKNAVVHAHGPDAAWLCRLFGEPAWVAHLHSDMAREMPSYWPRARRLASLCGHVLDYAAVSAPESVGFSSAGPRITIAPVVPDYEIRHVAKSIRPPSRTPTVVYLGNSDRYQALEALFRVRWPRQVRRRWLVNHPPLAVARHHAESAGFEVIHVESAEQMLTLTADAWWGLCPRCLPAGYPYKLLTFAMLGIPVLASRDWEGPVTVRRVPSWTDLPIDWSRAPERLEAEPIREATRQTLDRLEVLYRRLSSLLPSSG